MRVVALTVAVLAACGPTGPLPKPPAMPAEPVAKAAPTPKLVTVTVVSAEIAGTMPNGQEWDARDRKSDAVDTSIAMYLTAHPELSDTQDTIGVPIDAAKLGDEADNSEAADPMVLVQVDDAVYRSPMRPRAFNPVWEFSFQFVYDPAVAKDTNVRVLVVDYDGPTRFDTVGAKVLGIDALLAKPVHEFAGFGSVTKLTLEVAVDELPAAQPLAVRRLAIPGNASWTDAGIDVIAGQKITIAAADEVCTKGDDLQKCSGPEGQRATSEHNLPGFSKLGHGALVAALGDTRFAIKRERTFIAPSSGRLRLGVNDRDVSNNRGSYAVQITVDLP